jgi:hypothetical protein
VRSALGVRFALVLATGAHLLVAGAIRLLPAPAGPGARARARDRAAPVVEVTIDEAPVRARERERDELAPARVTEPQPAAAPAMTHPARVRVTTPLEDEPLGEAPAADRRWAFDPTRRPPPEIGLGSRWRSVAGDAETPTSTEGEARAAAQAVRESMSNPLAERDVELGLGRGGPLVTAAREAASAPDAPLGTTVLEVDWDAAGTVVAARADDHAWGAVAAALVRGMAGKPLRVRPGARGMRARLRVVAERTLPAGTRGTSAPGAVPDDIAGGKLKVCEGEGMTRRCLAGMPVGVTGSVADLSNIGASERTVVHAWLLGEAAL